jgi:hypothetical protein
MRTFGWAVLICVLSACGGDDSGTPDGGDDASDDITATDASNDVSSDSSDAGVVTETGPQGLPGRGEIGFSRNDLNGVIYEYMSARFEMSLDGGPIDPPPPTPPCTSQVGSCCYRLVVPSDGGAGPPATTKYVCAGTLSMFANKTQKIAQLNCDDAGTLEYGGGPQPYWNDGDSVDVSASGGAIHPFSGGVGAALLLKNVAPKIASNATTTVSVSKNLVVTWTKSNSSSVSLSLSAGGHFIDCNAPDQGTITVDHTLLANMPIGQGFIGLERSTSSPVVCDNADLTIDTNAQLSGAASFTP